MAGRFPPYQLFREFLGPRTSYLLGYISGQAVIIAWRFAILGDFEVDELEGQEGSHLRRFK